MGKRIKEPPSIRDRIVELRRVKASDILPSPKNWRTHPESQRSALRGILGEVGIADKLGAIRQRREDTLARAYNLTNLNRARLLEIAIFDALGLTDSEARAAILTRLASQLPETFDAMLPIERELARIVAGVQPLLASPNSNK